MRTRSRSVVGSPMHASSLSLARSRNTRVTHSRNLSCGRPEEAVSRLAGRGETAIGATDENTRRAFSIATYRRAGTSELDCRRSADSAVCRRVRARLRSLAAAFTALRSRHCWYTHGARYTHRCVYSVCQTGSADSCLRHAQPATADRYIRPLVDV